MTKKKKPFFPWNKTLNEKKKEKRINQEINDKDLSNSTFNYSESLVT